jgi:hypothetical protein
MPPLNNLFKSFSQKLEMSPLGCKWHVLAAVAIDTQHKTLSPVKCKGNIYEKRKSS